MCEASLLLRDAFTDLLSLFVFFSSCAEHPTPRGSCVNRDVDFVLAYKALWANAVG